MLKTAAQAKGDFVVIKATSYLTGHTGEEMEKEFLRSIDAGHTRFIINFKDTEIINSIGISIIIGIIEKIMESKGEIYLSNLSKVNEEIFRMMGLLRYAPLIRGEN